MSKIDNASHRHSDDTQYSKLPTPSIPHPTRSSFTDTVRDLLSRAPDNESNDEPPARRSSSPRGQHRESSGSRPAVVTRHGQREDRAGPSSRMNPSPNTEGGNNWTENPRSGHQVFPSRPAPRITPEQLYPGEVLNDWGQAISELQQHSRGGKDIFGRSVTMRIRDYGNIPTSKDLPGSIPMRDGRLMVQPARPVVLLANPDVDNRSYQRSREECVMVLDERARAEGRTRNKGFGMGTAAEMRERVHLRREVQRPKDHFRYDEASGSGLREVPGNEEIIRGGRSSRRGHNTQRTRAMPIIDSNYGENSDNSHGRRLPGTLEQFDWIRRAWDQHGFAGYCHCGREWVRMVGGYKCHAGRHMVTDELLANSILTTIGCGEPVREMGMYVHFTVRNETWEYGPFYGSELYEWTGKPGDRGPTVQTGTGRAVRWQNVPLCGPFENYEAGGFRFRNGMDNASQQVSTSRDYGRGPRNMR